MLLEVSIPSLSRLFLAFLGTSAHEKGGYTNIFDAERGDREARSNEFVFRSAKKQAPVFIENVALKLRQGIPQH